MSEYVFNKPSLCYYVNLNRYTKGKFGNTDFAPPLSDQLKNVKLFLQCQIMIVCINLMSLLILIIPFLAMHTINLIVKSVHYQIVNKIIKL